MYNYISNIANERQQTSYLSGNKQTYYLTVSIPVSMFLSSLLTTVITTLIVYLIMKRSYNKDTPPTTITQLDPICDHAKLPEMSEHKETIELQGNTAMLTLLYIIIKRIQVI